MCATLLTFVLLRELPDAVPFILQCCSASLAMSETNFWAANEIRRILHIHVKKSVWKPWVGPVQSFTLVYYNDKKNSGLFTYLGNTKSFKPSNSTLQRNCIYSCSFFSNMQNLNCCRSTLFCQPHSPLNTTQTFKVRVQLMDAVTKAFHHKPEI